MKLSAIIDSLENIGKCLNKIEDETEVRPGEKTIRGTDAGVIDGAEIMLAVDVARDDILQIMKELACP